MNNQEQSWKGLPEEQLTDKLAGQIRSQADPEAIRKRKRSVQDKIFIQIQQRKKKTRRKRNRNG